jgi:phosphoglycerate dehydrogenase-like enzyme
MAEGKVVFVTDSSDEFNDQVIRSTPAGLTTMMVPNHVSDDEEIAALTDADFLLSFRGTFSERVLRSARKLQFIQLLLAGYDLMDLQLLQELGIPCATSGDATAPAVAEYTIMLILAVSRQLQRADATVRAGGWRFANPSTNPNTYFDLVGKRVGLVGLGNIGQHVAKRLRGFDCQMQYAKRHPLSVEQERELGVKHVNLHALFATSDIVTLHVPLTAETAHLVGRDALALMKPSTILINTSRGRVVDEAALIEALQHGTIAGAGLDVFEHEPPASDNPLLQMDNVIVTPHVSGGSRDSRTRMCAFSWQNIKDVWEGKAPRAVVTTA